jgi:hypothetical protein
MAVIKINMIDAKGDQIEAEFLLKNSGIKPFQYHRDLSALANKFGNNNFELTFAMAVQYFPKVIGKDRFKIEGLDDNVKFAEVLEEFFINDPLALDELAGEVGFFLSPALKNKLK